MKEQKTENKRAGYLLTNENMDETVIHLGRPFLSGEEFEQLTDLWQERLPGNWFIADNTKEAFKRRQFVSRLQIIQNKWREVIEEQTKRFNEDERQAVKSLLIETCANPLKVLNCIGYPPKRILDTIAGVYRNRFEKEQFELRLRSKRLRLQDAKVLQSAAKILVYDHPLLGDETVVREFSSQLSKFAHRIQFADIQDPKVSDSYDPSLLFGDEKGGAPKRRNLKKPPVVCSAFS